MVWHLSFSFKFLIYTHASSPRLISSSFWKMSFKRSLLSKSCLLWKKYRFSRKSSSFKFELRSLIYLNSRAFRMSSMDFSPAFFVKYMVLCANYSLTTFLNSTNFTGFSPVLTSETYIESTLTRIPCYWAWCWINFVKGKDEFVVRTACFMFSPSSKTAVNFNISFSLSRERLSLRFSMALSKNKWAFPGPSFFSSCASWCFYGYCSSRTQTPTLSKLDILA